MKQHITVAYWLDALCDTTNKLDVFVALQAFDYSVEVVLILVTTVYVPAILFGIR